MTPVWVAAGIVLGFIAAWVIDTRRDVRRYPKPIPAAVDNTAPTVTFSDLDEWELELIPGYLPYDQDADGS